MKFGHLPWEIVNLSYIEFVSAGISHKGTDGPRPHTVFDSTLGFPGEGPASQDVDWDARVPCPACLADMRQMRHSRRRDCSNAGSTECRIGLFGREGCLAARWPGIVTLVLPSTALHVGSI
jgi:hypothetical protein